MGKTEAAPVLLFDGNCGLCTRVVQRVLRADRQRALLFASLQGAFSAGVRTRHPELANVDSIAWVEPPRGSLPERVYVRSDAVLRLARYLGFPWRLAILAHVVPKTLRDRVYDGVAQRRHQWFREASDCGLSTPAERQRMVD